MMHRAFLLHLFFQSVTSSSSSTKKSCALSDLTLSHLSLEHYMFEGAEHYTSCLNGHGACFRLSGHHDCDESGNVKVACPPLLASLVAEFTGDGKKNETLAHRQLGVAQSKAGKLWPGGVVCYAVEREADFDADQELAIFDAMVNVESLTNVRFMFAGTCQAQGLTDFCGGCSRFIKLVHAGKESQNCNATIGYRARGSQNTLHLGNRCFKASHKRDREGTFLNIFV